MNQFQYIAAIAFLLNTLYFTWLVTVITSPLSLLFFIFEGSLYVLVLLYIVNNYRRRYLLRGGTYSLRSIVDVYITTKNEPVPVVITTAEAAMRILHPNMRIYILDDGGRPALEHYCKSRSLGYFHRTDADMRPYKAANLNYAFSRTYGSFILTLDADTVPSERILDDLLGFFRDPTVAFVTTRQGFTVPRDNFNNDRLFYDYMQTGRNVSGSAISTGAGVIYRRSSLETIGGFSEWNLVEDLTTSFELNCRGFRSIYTPQRYVYGDAPRDLWSIYKQRGFWALDTLRLFFRKNPLLVRGLTFSQRLAYTEG